MMALGMGFGLGPPSLLELLLLLALIVILACTWEWLVAMGAALLLLPIVLLTMLLEILFRVCVSVGECLSFYLGYMVGGGAVSPPADPPEPVTRAHSRPVNEAWLRFWMEEIDQLSDAHLHSVKRTDK